MRADEKRFIPAGFQALDLFNAGFSDGGDDLFIMDDVAKHQDARFFLRRLKGDIQGALDTETEAG